MPAPRYHTGTRGVIGSEFAPGGAGANTGVIPAVMLLDSNGAEVGSATSPQSTQPVPSTAATSALMPVTATNAFSLQVKASAGNFYGGSITAGATAGLLIAYNANAAPASGAALMQNLLLGVVAVGANGSAAIGDYNIPDRFSAGIVLLFSTTLATYTQPANAAQFLRGRAA